MSDFVLCERCVTVALPMLNRPAKLDALDYETAGRLLRPHGGDPRPRGGISAWLAKRKPRFAGR